MIIKFHRKFKKSLAKQPRKIQLQFKKRVRLFSEDQFDPILSNHALTGKLKGLRSINITGDIRVHYEQVDEVIILMDIGSHSELY